MITVQTTPIGIDMTRSLANRRNKLLVSGLSEGPNAIPHGLPFTPSMLRLRPGAAGLWGETSAPDSTSIYITVGTGGATAGIIDCEEL
jgi:hypothetical protein